MKMSTINLKKFVAIPKEIVKECDAYELGIIRILLWEAPLFKRSVTVSLRELEERYGITRKTLAKYLKSLYKKNLIIYAPKRKFTLIAFRFRCKPHNNFIMDKREYFVKMNRCSLLEHGVFITLLSYKNYNMDFSYPSPSTVAELCGISRRAAYKAIDSLCKVGVIRIVPFRTYRGYCFFGAPTFERIGESAETTGINNASIGVNNALTGVKYAPKPLFTGVKYAQEQEYNNIVNSIKYFSYIEQEYKEQEEKKKEKLLA